MMYMMKNKGFTLIELLIMIAIIGILFAITIPTYMALRNRRNGFDNNTKDTYQPAVELVSHDDLRPYVGTMDVIRHIETGCQYIGRYDEWELIPGTCYELE